MSSTQTLWMLRGRQAGTFQYFPEERARLIVEAGMAQNVKGRAAHQLDSFTRTDEDYPTIPTITREAKAEKAKPKAKGTYKRRDLRAEERQNGAASHDHQGDTAPEVALQPRDLPQFLDPLLLAARLGL